MNKLFFPMLLTSAVMMTACSNEDVETFIDNSLKSKIEFTSQDLGVVAKTRAGFNAPTGIVMRIKSTNNSKESRYTRTIATAAQATGAENSVVSFNGAYQRYWDDAWGRDAHLSVYAVAVPGKILEDNNKLKEDSLKNGSDEWFTEDKENENINWDVTTSAQTSALQATEDLVYSNNIQGDFALKFNLTNANNSEGTGTFEKGDLKFKHALTRITIKLVEGEGFNADAKTDFQFAAGTNVKLLNMPAKGTLNLTDGTWITTTSDIDKIYQVVGDDASSELMGQVLPGYELTADGTDNMMSFTIDDNKYYITKAMAYKALEKAVASANGKITLGEGTNYVFTINVNKTGISLVSASIAPWDEINAEEMTPNNAYFNVNLKLHDGTTDENKNFDLYRSTGDNYTDQAALTDNKQGGYSTNWFFETNNIAYNFRAVNQKTTINNGTTFAINSGAQDAAHDYLWGAPMKSVADLKYSLTDGFKNNIFDGIKATDKTINLIEMHMMSRVNVNLKTTTTADKVDLKDATVELEGFYTDGTVTMSNGLVTTTGSKGNTNFTGPTTEAKTFTHSYSVVPQPVNGLVFRITLANKSYYIIKDLTDGGKISNWIPGHVYNYTFKLTKTGIQSMTCSVKDWETVNAASTDVKLTD